MPEKSGAGPSNYCDAGRTQFGDRRTLPPLGREDPMSFTLTVSFHGMNLFVREGTQALHVLMPSTGSGDGCGCADPHAPRLIVDTAYMRSGQTGLDGVVAHCSLQNRKLEFTQGGSALDNSLPAELAKLGPLAAGVLDGTAADLLSGRVLIQNGACSDYAKGACWSWQGQIQRLSHVVEWSVADVPGDSLSLTLQLLNGAFGGAVPTLYPVNGVVEMEIWHAPHSELPPDSLIPPPPARGGGAQHFTGFNRLLATAVNDIPAYEPDSCAPIENPGKYDTGKGAATYSCVGGEGGPG
jgi:hypothetical protein